MTLIKNPILKINGKTVAYEPNSFKYMKGLPKRNTFPTTVNGALIRTEDPSVAYGTVKFELRSTGDNESLFDEWINNGDANAITFSDGEANKSASSAMVANTDVEIEKGSDTTFEVIFETNPVQ